LFVVLLALVLGCGSAAPSAPPAAQPTAGGAPQSEADLAQYKGADRTQVLEARAREEGGPVVIYSNGTVMQPLLNQFEKKYPFLKVQLVTGDAATISRRVTDEYKAGRHDVDGFETSIEGLILPGQQGVLQAYYSPELTNYPDKVKSPQGYWTIVRESYIGLGFNTNKLKEAEVPHSYHELGDPKWKGRMAVSDSTSTGANLVGAMLTRENEEFVRSLKAQNIRVIQGTGRVVADLIISGEVDLSPTIYNSHVADSASKGAPIAWVALEPDYVTEVVFAIASQAPHPAATLLLADYLLSKEGQELYQTIGYGSSYAGLVNKETSFEKLYASLDPSYVQNFPRWSKLFQETFLQAS
jgi:ABC-type Fe3+ transport system substrate-binding protein